MRHADWSLQCPVCRTVIGNLSELHEHVVCQQCGTLYDCRDGIWHFLPPERASFFAPFLRDYATIRQAEKRGFDDPAAYLRLPDCPTSDPLAWQWRMRATSLRYLQKHVLKQAAALQALDLGAGVGWLSYRLAQLGVYPCAVDLTIDAHDGLGAARHYTPSWPRFQAEFNRLPLADHQADLVIYNASFHYSSDYTTTLSEALRVVRSDGQIVIMDTPIYRNDTSGQQMVAQRQAAFERSYGTRSDTLRSVGYLTWTMLRDLAARLGIHWQIFRPWYGWRWALRPLVARFKGAREPSTFALLVARRTIGRNV